METTINDTISLVAENLTRQSAVIKHLVKEEKVKIIKRSTTLDNEKVSLFDDKWKVSTR